MSTDRLLLLMLLILSACGPARVSKRANHTLHGLNEKLAPKFQGSYDSACTKDSVGGGTIFNQAHYLISTSVDSGTITEQKTTYLDSDCQMQVSQAETEGMFGVSAEGTRMEISYTAAFLQPLTDQIAVHYRVQNLCNRNDWQVGVSKSIISEPCFTQTGAKWLSIEDDNANQFFLYSCGPGGVFSDQCSQMILTRTQTSI